MTRAAQFIAALFTGSLTRGDAIVVLAGDGETRLNTALRAWAMGGADTLVLTGGRDDPPFSLTATKMAGKLYAKEFPPSLLVVDDAAQNTREQAVNTLALARDRGWTRLLLVASAFHMPRALLTFIRALNEAGMADEVELVPVPTETPWWDKPAGKDATRMDLLADEFDKCATYSEHVATWEEGLAYLRTWEGK